MAEQPSLIGQIKMKGLKSAKAFIWTNLLKVTGKSSSFRGSETSPFTTRASSQQPSLCGAGKAGPWTLESPRVLSSILLPDVRIRDGPHPAPTGVMQWTADSLTKCKTLPSYSSLINYCNSPRYVCSTPNTVNWFGYFSPLLFSSVRSAERTPVPSLHR